MCYFQVLSDKAWFIIYVKRFTIFGLDALNFLTGIESTPFMIMKKKIDSTVQLGFKGRDWDWYGQVIVHIVLFLSLTNTH